MKFGSRMQKNAKKESKVLSGDKMDVNIEFLVKKKIIIESLKSFFREVVSCPGQAKHQGGRMFHHPPHLMSGTGIPSTLPIYQQPTYPTRLVTPTGVGGFYVNICLVAKIVMFSYILK